MGNIFSVQITKKAANEIYKIIDYIEYELKNPTAGAKQFLDFQTRIEQLKIDAELYQVFMILDEIKIRRINVNKYLLLYMIEGKVATVLRAFHGNQDIKKQVRSTQ
ncbi:MAG: type II toxin-antitoxin system RelE/ParE family toxin [Lactobacillaceae bacterium]|nr:type II toxin-antitoxin system RelE/ParE family toxin [Lactobacillaceae bacterium]